MSDNSSSTGRILKQGSILAAASVLVRLIGMIYRIPMANIIGDEGNGIYSAAFEVYSVLLIISSYGMPMAVSKMVSAKCAKNEYRGAVAIFRYSLIFAFLSGGITTLAVWFGADWIERTFFSKFSGISIPLRVLAPTILIVAIMGVIRGFFQGRNTMLPTAISQIVEQIINAFVSVAAAYWLIKAHDTSKPAWGAAGGTLGTCLGAASALLLLLGILFVYNKTFKKQVKEDKLPYQIEVGQSYKLIFMTVIPIILSQTVYQLSGILDVTIYNFAMGAQKYSDKMVSTWQGIYSTKYRLLVSVPIAVSTAIASSMIPSLVKSITEKDQEGIQTKVSSAVKFNMIIAFPCAVGLAALGIPIIRLLFPASDYTMGGLMLLLGSSCIIFYALSTVTSGVLQSADKMSLPVIHSLISLIIHVILLFVLLMTTKLNAYALVIGNVTYPMLVCYLNGRSVRKTLGFKQEVYRTFIIPLISSLIMGGLTYGTYVLFMYLTHRFYIALIPAFMVALGSYFVLVLKLKGLTRLELYDFPFGRRMSILADKLHLLSD